METYPSPFTKRVLWHILIGISLYWFTTVLVVFPWLVSKIFGVIAMFLTTIMWGYMSFYCLKHVPREEWTKDTISMGICFLLTAVIQDYLLYAVYRGVPDEIYEPTTFLAYGVVFFMPFFVRYILLVKYNQGKILIVSNAKLLITLAIGVVSLFITLWSIRFW